MKIWELSFYLWRSIMSGLTVLEALRAVRFFDGIPEAEHLRLASLGRLEEYEPDDVLFRQGQRHGSVFVVTEGEVALDIRVPEHGARWFQTVGPGQLLGWSPILGKPPLTASATALT